MFFQIQQQGDPKEIVKTLIAIAECAVCHNTLHPDTVVCLKGHHVCKECRNTQILCPTCKSDFSIIQSTLVKRFLQIIPHRCKNKPCQTLLNAGGDHERFCAFRHTKCKVPLCTWEGPCQQLENHVDTSHKYNSTFGEYFFYSDGQFDVSRNYDGVSLCKRDRHTSSLSRKENYLLWLELRNDPLNKDITFTFTPVVMCNPQSNSTVFAPSFWKPYTIHVNLSFVTNTTSLSSFQIEINPDEESCEDNRINVSQAMVCQYYKMKHFRLDVNF